ncbi:MAG: hypothetical protein LBE08_04650, partial [Bifidobacteriaceae bacterium]|nr:hypothetical protein [Bifidobacteriaceae bacterium]
TAYSAEDDFTGAALVLGDLGEVGRPARVLSDPAGIAPGGVVDLPVLNAVLAPVSLSPCQPQPPPAATSRQ